jgi:all-trans-8'-apo-beta-carotenal 15,15'-oxygenase
MTVAPAWFGAFRDLPRAHGFEPLRIEGAIPYELSGMLYRCGPGAMACGARRYAHPFDGDGAITAVRFERGAAWGATRLVETPGFVAERRAGKPLHPAYGTLAPGSPRRMPRPKNAANTSVMAWSKRLYALHEASPPTEFEPSTLETIGEADLGSPDLRDGFSAHPRLVPSRRALFNFGMRYGANTTAQLFQLREGSPPKSYGIPLSGATMIHDFVATERFLVFFAPPLRLRVAEFVAGRVPYGEALDWQPQHGTEVLLVRIDEPSSVVRFESEPFFQWHFANAYERGRELVVDFVRYPDFGTNRWMASLVCAQPWQDVKHGSLARATIDPIDKTIRTESLAGYSLEYPRVAPAVETRPHRYVYAVAHSPQRDATAGLHDRLARVDVETGEVLAIPLAKGQYPSEPMFVPRSPRETDGWLATLVYDASSDASHIAIFDAEKLDTGPIARAWFDHHVPFTFHGIWRGRDA